MSTQAQHHNYLELSFAFCRLDRSVAGGGTALL
jgi:hypothetical protein